MKKENKKMTKLLLELYLLREEYAPHHLICQYMGVKRKGYVDNYAYCAHCKITYSFRHPRCLCCNRKMRHKYRQKATSKIARKERDKYEL